MMKRGHIGIGVVLVGLMALPCSAQELDPHDPAAIAERLNRASAVVIGKFQVAWCLPWFDGWHCSGAVHVTESLHGSWKANDAVQFQWKEPYGGTCLVCTILSPLDGHEGIWFLTKKNDTWTFTPAGAFWCGAPLPLGDRDAVTYILRQRDRK
jgi:hypothetical protein